jgi:hypothetical protein
MEDANAWRLCDGRANEIKDPVLMIWKIKVVGWDANHTANFILVLILS